MAGSTGCCSIGAGANPLCTLVVDARDKGRFLLLVDAAVLDRDRGLGGFVPRGGWSMEISAISSDLNAPLVGTASRAREMVLTHS